MPGGPAGPTGPCFPVSPWKHTKYVIVTVCRLALPICPCYLSKALRWLTMGINIKWKHTQQEGKGNSPLLLCLQVFHLLQGLQVRPICGHTVSSWIKWTKETEGGWIRDIHRFSRKSNWPNRSVCTGVTLQTKRGCFSWISQSLKYCGKIEFWSFLWE